MSENEKNPVNCIQCNYLKESMQKFSCNHLICKECLCLLLIENEFNHNKINLSNISLQCPECLGEFKSTEKCPNLILSYSELNNLFSNSNNTPLKCIKHPNEELKYYCEACNNELCEECKNLDNEHDTSQIELEDIKADEAEKLLQNQCLTLDELKNKIDENKNKKCEENSKAKEKILNDYFDLIKFTYEKYYSMISSNQISFKKIREISKMKNILNISISENDILSEKIDSINSFILNQANEIKNISQLKIDLIFKDGLIQTGNCFTLNTEHKELMTGGILINNGNNLITSSTDNSLIIYEKKIYQDNKISFNIIKKILDKKAIATSLLNLVSDYFVVGYNDGLIKIWRTNDYEIDKIFTGHSSQINKIIKESENSFISCSDDMTICGWSLDSLEADASYILTGHEDRINDILLINENSILISVSDDMTLRIWNLEIKECINAIKTGDIQTCLGNLKYNKFMVGGEDGSITIFETEGFEPINSIKAHDEPIEIIYESPFTGEIISGSQDGLVKIFKADNYTNYTCVKILKGHNNSILSVQQIDENNILTSSVDKTVKIWKI